MIDIGNRQLAARRLVGCMEALLEACWSYGIFEEHNRIRKEHTMIACHHGMGSGSSLASSTANSPADGSKRAKILQ